MGFFDFLDTPIDWTVGLFLILIIAVISYVIMKKRGELARSQAKIEEEIVSSRVNDGNSKPDK